MSNQIRILNAKLYVSAFGWKKGGFMKVMLVVVLLSSMLFGQILYEEHFTDGNMQLDWHPWVQDGDSMTVASDPTTPGGDGWIGMLSNEAAMVAATYSGTSDLADYSIESWIYTIVVSGMGPYNGVVIRLDTTANALYSLISDFDGDARLRLRLLEGATPTVIRDWASGEIPGGVPATSS